MLAPLQPLLRMIVMRVVSANPEILNRLGPHQMTRFVIDPVDLPFVLLLRPRSDEPVLEARTRLDVPVHDARICGKFLDLVRLIDAEDDGDAMFFLRDLTIFGDTEAVVTLRNAIDDIDGSLAERVADMLGLPSRMALAVIRRSGGWVHRTEQRQT